MNRVIIWTDGACKNNGFNKSIGGIGIYFGDNDIRNISEKIEGYVTNNRAEMLAAIKAIYISLYYGYTCIEIRSDSQYLVKGITQWIHGWKRKNWNKVKNPDLWKWLDKITSTNIDIKWTHVKAHCGIKGNEMADYLANQCL